MHSLRDNKASPRAVESLLVILGAAACLGITLVIWRSISAYQPMWPLPGLYFLEIVALSILCALVFVLGGPSGGTITWAAVGMLAAFSILGALSVGFFYLPVTLLFGVAALIYDLRNKQSIAAHLGACLLAGVAQAALMLALIHLL